MAAHVFRVGDVVRTSGGKADRIVVSVRAALPPAEYTARLASYEAGDARSKPWPEVDMFTTRSLRDGRLFGPEMQTRADRLTLIRPAEEK